MILYEMRCNEMIIHEFELASTKMNCDWLELYDAIGVI